VIGLGFSIFGGLLWLAFTLIAIFGGGAILFQGDYYDAPPRWLGLVGLVVGLLSGSFMLAAMISS
jgi:hypothetical protein